MQVSVPGRATCTPSHFGMSLGRGIQGTNLPPTSYPPPPPPPPPGPSPTPKSPSPAPLPPSLSPSVAVPPSAAVWSMPLCRVLWFVLNKLLSQKKKKSNLQGHQRTDPLTRLDTSLAHDGGNPHSNPKQRGPTRMGRAARPRP